MNEKEILKEKLLMKMKKFSDEFDEDDDWNPEREKKNYLNFLSNQLISLAASGSFANSIQANLLISEILGFSEIKEILQESLKKGEPKKGTETEIDPNKEMVKLSVFSAEELGEAK